MTSRAQQLRARCDHVLQLHEDGELERALALGELLLEELRHEDVNDPVVRETLFAARFERALLLTEQGDLAGASDAYAQAASTPSDMDDPDQRHELAMALLNRGICADAAGDPEGALRAYDELHERFADADDPVTLDQVVRGRVNRAASLLSLGQVEAGLAQAEQVAADLDPQDALESEQLAMAIRLQASALQALGRSRDAASVLGHVDRCTDDDPAARSQVAAARRERAELLADLGDLDDAIDLLDQTVERLREDPNPVVTEILADLVDTEVALLTRAGDPDRAARVRAAAGDRGP